MPIALFLVAGVLALLLETPVRWLSRAMPRPLAIALTTVGTLALVAVVATLLGLQLAQQAQGLLADLEAALHRSRLPMGRTLQEEDLESLLKLFGKGFGHGLGLLGGAFSNLMGLVVVLVLNVLHPRVMGRALSLHRLVLFFALFVGERMAGLLGVFLAVPVAGMIVNWPRLGTTGQEMRRGASQPSPSCVLPSAPRGGSVDR